MNLSVKKIAAFYSHTKGKCNFQLAPLLSKLADQLLKIELIWVMPALAFTCASLLCSVNYSWVGLVIASIPFLLRRWRKGYFSHRTLFDLPVGLFFVASLIGLFVSPARELSLEVFQGCLACILVYYSLVNILHSGYVKWGFVFTIMCVLVAVLLAFSEGLSPPSITGRLGIWIQEQLQHLPQMLHLPNFGFPATSTPHGLTIALEIILIPLIGISLFTWKLSKKMIAVFSSLIFLMLLLLLLFGSQGAWIAVGVAVLFLFIWRSRWSLLPVSAALGIGYLGFRYEWFDLQLFILSNPQDSLEVRLGLWQGAIDVIQDYPITGCGLGCLGQFSNNLNPHNAYLQFYADMGIVGALALLCALVIVIKIAINLLSSARTHPWYGFAVGLVATVLAIGVHGFFEVTPAGILYEGTDTYYYIVSPILWVLAGSLVRTQRILEGNHEGCSAKKRNEPFPLRAIQVDGGSENESVFNEE